MVCTGNTCRSPMAEAIFRRWAAERGADIEVRSAGVAALNGQPMSSHAAAVLRARGIEPGGFQSTEMDEALIDWAELIFTMTSHHKRRLLEQFPAAVEKTYALKEYAGAEDPLTAALLEERESLAAELQLKLALGQSISDAERDRLHELERRLPDYDVADPIGGSRSRYEQTADEIETAIRSIVNRLYSKG